jgi:hypothetical protein
MDASLKAPGPFRCIVLIGGVGSTAIEVALSERGTGSDAERGLSTACRLLAGQFSIFIISFFTKTIFK